MDMTFIEGISAVAAGLIVFCGSVWLLLTMIVGTRLAYFVTATITLGFIFILGLVWSLTNPITPLGPVGKLPTWDPVDIVAEGGQIDFEPASEYPEGSWQPPNEDDQAQVTQANELETSAADYLEEQITAEKIDTFESAADATPSDDTTLLLQQGDEQYGAVTLEPAPGKKGENTIVVMKYDPGNPLGTARVVTLGVFVLFVLHLLGLSLSERRAQPVAETRQPVQDQG